HMYYQDQLVLTGAINDVGEYTRVNVPRSYRLGLELEGRWQGRPGLDVQGGFTLSRNKLLDYTRFVDTYDLDFNYTGQERVEQGRVDMAFSPALVGNIQIAYDFLHRSEKGHSFQMALMHKYVGLQYLDNTADGQAKLDPYFYGDLRLSYALPLPGVRRIEATLL
ncbi:TonB-dependent receptor, partial [Arthrospira platensis SPKY1]|nr:TonB-dependent receptor [Arthrospira platensis SPKY1]